MTSGTVAVGDTAPDGGIISTVATGSDGITRAVSITTRSRVGWWRYNTTTGHLTPHPISDDLPPENIPENIPAAS